MKKLSIISNQIKNNTYSYTGKGSFEAIVNQNKEIILEWLEDLIPLQKQIDMLKELTDLEFQKRNYTRILTKVFPDEYTEFVSLNILVRDAHAIAQHYDDEYNVTILYNNLIEHKYLKYPGKYDKYVSYNVFQKFLMMYREDLMKSLENDEAKDENKNEIEDIDFDLDDMVEEPEVKITKENQSQEDEKKIEEIAEANKPKETNWTNLLLGRLK
jgi:hypothetical protein